MATLLNFKLLIIIAITERLHRRCLQFESGYTYQNFKKQNHFDSAFLCLRFIKLYDINCRDDILIDLYSSLKFL